MKFRLINDFILNTGFGEEIILQKGDITVPNENGDYVSGIVINNNHRYVMKRYQLQPEPIDLEKEYAA